MMVLEVELRPANCPRCEGYGFCPGPGSQAESEIVQCDQCRGTGGRPDKGYYEISDGCGYVMLEQTFLMGDVVEPGSDAPF